MPKSCSECPFDYDSIDCNLLKESYPGRSTDEGFDNYLSKRMLTCPLIEVPIDYDELIKAAKAMHTWIFLNSVDEQEAYDECGLTDEMNAVLGYAGSFNIIPADKDGET